MIQGGDANLTRTQFSPAYYPLDALADGGIQWAGSALLYKSGELLLGSGASTLQAVRAETAKRHNGSYDVVFCDAHIEIIPRQKLYSTYAAALRRWNWNNEPIP
jgi:prepilin-type processing-associated H-X9-DG protein